MQDTVEQTQSKLEEQLLLLTKEDIEFLTKKFSSNIKQEEEVDTYTEVTTPVVGDTMDTLIDTDF